MSVIYMGTFMTLSILPFFNIINVINCKIGIDPLGSCWFHIGEKPPCLVQISAGKSSVWARDKNGKEFL